MIRPVQIIMAWFNNRELLRQACDHEKEKPAAGWRECPCGWCVSPQGTYCVACGREVAR